MRDVDYLSGNFIVPRPIRSRVRPDVRDRQTSDVRQKHRLMLPPYGCAGITRPRPGRGLMLEAKADANLSRPRRPRLLTDNNNSTAQ